MRGFAVFRGGQNERVFLLRPMMRSLGALEVTGVWGEGVDQAAGLVMVVLELGSSAGLMDERFEGRAGALCSNLL